MDSPPTRIDKELAEPLDSDLVRQFLQTQAQELALRSEELVLEKHRVTNTHEYAQKSLEAQINDRDRQRQFTQTLQRDRLIFAGVMSVLLIAFIFYALHLNKDQVVLEVLKCLIFLFAGGLGGYALGKARDKKTQEDR